MCLTVIHIFLLSVISWLTLTILAYFERSALCVSIMWQILTNRQCTYVVTLAETWISVVFVTLFLLERKVSQNI